MDDENDETLWDSFTRDIEPIERQKPISERSTQDKQKAVKERTERPTLREPVQRKPLSSGQEGLGLDRRSAEKLRKGQMPIEAQLDLHGMTQVQAQTALRDFIVRAQAAGKRCVLVITGKGVGEDGRRDPLSSGQGVLKRMVPVWLEEPDLRPLVLKTSAARPQHGGGGALYVLLRRNRSN